MYNNKFSNLYIDKGGKINPYLLSIIIEVVTDEFNSDSISAEVFRAIILDLCVYYSEIIFSDTKNKVFAKKILFFLNEETIRYLKICLVEFQTKSYSANISRDSATLYVEDVDEIEPTVIGKVFTEVVDKFILNVIPTHDFREVILDLCSIYGNLLFIDLTYKHYTKEMLDQLSEKTMFYISLCVAKYQLKSISCYEDPDFTYLD